MKVFSIRMASALLSAACLVATGAAAAQRPNLELTQIEPRPIPIPHPPVPLPPQPNVFDGGNRWLITAYNDASAEHQRMATQGLCFLPYSRSGTHIRGIWFSDTFPNWNGRYSQEGDRVLLHGDYAEEIGHDGMVIELFARDRHHDEGAGQWTEWREDRRAGRTVVFANARMRRVGRCPVFEADSEEPFPIVFPRYKDDGRMAENPLDLGQELLPEERELDR